MKNTRKVSNLMLWFIFFLILLNSATILALAFQTKYYGIMVGWFGFYVFAGVIVILLAVLWTKNVIVINLGGNKNGLRTRKKTR